MKNKKMYLALSVFVVVFAAVGFIVTQPVNSLTMDVNPSIEIVTNRLDRVVEINPLNPDAKALLKDFKPRDKNLETTVNDLVDLMILTGHIKGGEDNFVMITVSDDSVDNRLVDKVNRAIAAMLENKQIEATILNQAIARSNKSEKQTGVQLAAQKLQQMDNTLTADDIASMTVKEFIRISRENNIPLEKLFKVAAGDIDKVVEGRNIEGKKIEGKDIISRDEAKKIALEKVKGEVIKLELDDLYDHDDRPEYEVDILSDGVKYEIKIDAYTGEIIKLEIDDRDDWNDDKDDDWDDGDGAGRERITADQAKTIALKLTNGGKITEFELDDDEYKLEIKGNGKKYEIEIDAYTGKVLEFEVD
ncbi:MAG: PepSY domain-containing protein [Caldicoprobacterales bacterium]